MKKGDVVPLGQMKTRDVFTVQSMGVRCICLGRVTDGRLAAITDEGVKLDFPPKHFDELVTYLGQDVDASFSASPAPMAAGECPGPPPSKLTRINIGDLSPRDVFLIGEVRHIALRRYDDAGPRVVSYSEVGDTNDWGGASLFTSVIWLGRGRVEKKIVME